MQQAWHICICFVAILLFRSSDALSGWLGTIYRFLQRCLIGFWLGHSRTFIELTLSHSCIALAVCHVGRWTCRPFWALWTRFSLWISLYLAAFSFPSSLNTSPVPAAETHPTAWCCRLHSSCIWGEAWVLSLYDQAQIGGVSQWCLSFCKFLPSPDKITQLNQSDHQCLDHLSYQDPSPSIAQFGHGARSRKSPDCFKLHPLRIMKAKSSCEPSTQQFFL